MGKKTAEETGVEALREVLLSHRWDSQAGYPGFYDGKFHGTFMGLESKKALALFALAGLVPDEIKSRGACEDCAFAVSGRERGYARPCLDCARPSHSNFVPVGGLTRNHPNYKYKEPSR